jgi:hypothetical protein
MLPSLRLMMFGSGAASEFGGSLGLFRTLHVVLLLDEAMPTDLASALNGFQGDDYVLVGNRRVVAIIPEVAPT